MKHIFYGPRDPRGCRVARRATTRGAGGQRPNQDSREPLNLEKYKATIKGLTAFGDRRRAATRNAQGC